MEHYLYSDRISIRPIYQTDTDSIYAYRSLEEVARYQYWAPFSKEQTTKFVNQNKKENLNTRGKWIGLAIIYRDNGLLIGDCAIRINDDTAEIGCNISPEYQHKGLAKETIRLLIDYCFRKAEVKEVFGITDRENKASVQLMESLGMVKDSGFQEEIMCKGLLSVEHRYSIKKKISDVTIRAAQPEDSQAICDIYNHYVMNTAVTFELESVDTSEMRQRIQNITENGFPYFVAEVENKIVGYYYLNTWKKRKAYNTTAEVTIYLDKDQQGKGYGSALFDHLFSHLDRDRFHVLVGVICTPNEGSVRLHEKFGFHQVSQIKEVGQKFNQWWDIGDWQLIL